MKSKPALWWMLLGPVTAIVTAVAMMIMFMAFLATALAVFAAAMTATTAYVKREDWTLPAYRWTRNRTGRWRVTPWSGDGEAEVAQEETAD